MYVDENGGYVKVKLSGGFKFEYIQILIEKNLVFSSEISLNFFISQGGDI